MMINKEVGVMLYVDDVAKELDFWQAIGFHIIESTEIDGYQSFTMRPTMDSSTLFTIYDKAFIEKVSPEVADHQPSLLFETQELLQLYDRVSENTDEVSPMQTDPFPAFSFAAPSGHYYAVKGI